MAKYWHGPAPDGRKIMEIGALLPTLATINTPTGEVVEVRIIDDKLRVSISTNVDAVPEITVDAEKRNPVLTVKERNYRYNMFVPVSKKPE